MLDTFFFFKKERFYLNCGTLGFQFHIKNGASFALYQYIKKQNHQPYCMFWLNSGSVKIMWSFKMKKPVLEQSHDMICNILLLLYFVGTAAQW